VAFFFFPAKIVKDQHENKKGTNLTRTPPLHASANRRVTNNYFLNLKNGSVLYYTPLKNL
jgi:hypothetical protein